MPYVIETRHAVGVKNQIHIPTKAVFACGSMVFFTFFTKMLHYVQHFCEKDREPSALPEANRAVHPGKCLI